MYNDANWNKLIDWLIDTSGIRIHLQQDEVELYMYILEIHSKPRVSWEQQPP